VFSPTPFAVLTSSADYKSALLGLDQLPWYPTAPDDPRDHARRN
jgi:hypothetical protein